MYLAREKSYLCFFSRRIRFLLVCPSGHRNWASVTDRPSHKGMFTNYVDKILDIFWPPPPHVLTFSMVWTLTKSGHLKTTYLPRPANVVCEQLLTLVGVGPARAISKRNSVFLAILPKSSYYSVLVHFPQRCATAATRTNRPWCHSSTHPSFGFHGWTGPASVVDSLYHT